MAADSLVQTRIDTAVKERAAAVLGNMRLTVSDAARILLTHVVNEGALPFAFTSDPVAHDAWFRAKVQEALDDPRSAMAHVDVEAHFAKRRAVAIRNIGKDEA